MGSIPTPGTQNCYHPHMNTRPIGIIDSGVGGLTVWHEIVQRMPQESTVYAGDSKNCPYGTKSEEEIWELSKRLVEFLIRQNVKLIVIACNTISVTSLEKLREAYPQMLFIGTVPVVKTAALRQAQGKLPKIGILSTIRTAESTYMKNLIAEFAGECQVTNLGTDKLVPLIEQGTMEGKELDVILTEVLKPFQDAQIDTLALGCTHFPFLKAHMQRVLGSQVAILDSAEAIARQVQRVLEEKRLHSNKQGLYEFFTSGDPRVFDMLVRRLNDSAKIQSAQQITV